jgi:hypothetical protein
MPMLPMLRAWVLLLALLAAGAAQATALEPRAVQVLLSAQPEVPADSDTRWLAARTPDSRDVPVAWYRVEFEIGTADQASFWMLYLPYFYGGGRVWLNGEPVAAVLENSETLHVRWERPLLLPLPQNGLRAGRNVLHIRAVASHAPSTVKLPRLVLGPQQEVQGQFDRRLFVVRTLPLVTVVTGVVVGLFVIFIWLRRRQEVLYGLFGMAALLWALRTTTFVFDAMPTAYWPQWRMLYHASSGGFIIVLALFALSLAGWYRPRIAWALAAYWLLGPLLYVISGDAADEIVGRWWVLGLVPIGLSVALVSFAAAARQRTLGTLMIAGAVALAAVAGVHDYLVAWSSPWLDGLLPDWTGHRIFLLHHGANLLLAVMGALLTARFIRSLHEVEEANRTLEARVAEREREVAASYERIAQLQREQATQEERQRIMQELHDGLGSQLFTSLLRAERGALDGPGTVGALRDAIDEMRVAIEALASQERDFLAAFGDFRFRWTQRLQDAGLRSDWQVALADAPLPLPPHDALQVLRVAQEALTNVLKHAQAREVRISLRREGAELVLRVADDGRTAAGPAQEGSRGLANMRARAMRIGARLQVRLASTAEPGTEVQLHLPLRG